MKPIIKNKIDGYNISWEGSDINLTINRVHVHKDGKVTGELCIKKGEVGLLPSSQFNFSSERTRNSLAKSLNDRYKGYIDWTEVIDQMCHQVQKLSTEGEVVQTLWTDKEVKPPEFLVEPLIYKGLPNAIYGEKGVNKSTLAIVLYTCLLLPWAENPLGLSVPNRSIRPLILDWETEGEIVQYYANRLQIGMDLPAFEVFYRRCGLTLIDDVANIQKSITDVGAEAIIIDSLGAAAGGDLKSAEIAMQFFSALRKLKTTSIIIGQTSKNEEGRKRMFGSTYFEYYTRNIWELRKSNVTMDNDSDVALFNYSTNLSGKQKPIGIRFHYNETGMTVERTSVDMAEFKEKIDLQGKILETLSRGPLKISKIIERIPNCSESSIRVVVKRMKDAGKIMNTGYGEYGLCSSETDDELSF